MWCGGRTVVCPRRPAAIGFRLIETGADSGRQLRWLWAAYAISAYGSGFGFGAFQLIAIVVLGAGPAQVAALAAAGLAVGAAVALPLGPWVEFRRKRPVMVAMDLTRCAALLSVPLAYALGRLTFAQLLLVAVVVAAAKIAFNAASGAYLKAVAPPEQLLATHARFESTTWSATALGPPLGGAAIGLLGPMTTIAADAVSYLLSALAIGRLDGGEPRPRAAAGARLRGAELLDGWRAILADPVLRALFLNAIVVNGLIMATEPSLAVLMLGQLGFAPWQYGLAFAIPCAGGFVGARLARPLAARWGRWTMLRTAGALRACWLVGLPFVGAGVGGLALVIAVELGMILCIAVFNPLMATERLRRAASDRVARTLTAWSISSSLAIAALTALWGLLAALASPRAALALAGLLLLATPLLLPRGARVRQP